MYSPDAYQSLVDSLVPTYFWPLQGDVVATHGMSLNIGTTTSYIDGPLGGGQAARSTSMYLYNHTINANANSSAYSYGGWFKLFAGSTGTFMGNWDSDGSMLFSGRLYHQSGFYNYTQPSWYDPSEWNHLFVTWNGSTQYFWINGRVVSTRTIGGGLGSSVRMELGSYNGGNARTNQAAAWCGWWVNEALEEPDVRRLADALFVGSDSPMVLG